MAEKQYFENTQANESISKFKLLSAYGGPGSIVHTSYGSIIISCIEEWGFLKKILDIQKEAVDTRKKDKEIKIVFAWKPIKIFGQYDRGYGQMGTVWLEYVFEETRDNGTKTYSLKG